MGYNRVLGHFTNSQELAVPWQTGQLYLVNQIVIDSNLLYICITQHTSSGSFATDLAAGYWVAISGGGGTSTLSLTAGENLLAGDAVYISEGAADGSRTAGRAYKLDVTNSKRYNCVGLTTGAASSGSSVTVQINGALSGLSGLTTGLPVYGSTSTPGGFQGSIPTALNYWVVELGIATSATSLLLNPAGFATAYQIGANNWFTSNQLTVASGGTITLDGVRPLQKILAEANTTGGVTMSGTPFGTGSFPDGTFVIIIGNNSSNPISLVNNDAAKGSILNGDCTLYKYDSISLQYDGTLDRWVEVSRNS